MEKFRKMAWSILLAFVTIGFAACSDDDDNGNGGGVIPSVSNEIKSVGNMSMTYQGGVLTKITTTDGTVVTFKFPYESGGVDGNRSLKMEIREVDGYITYIDMQLNAKGFVERCDQTYANEPEVSTWEFKYNSDNQLNYMKRSEGENEVTTIKYENGNIVEVLMVSEEEGEGLHTKTFYTSEETTSPIANTQGIMLFDDTFGIDMDEMGYAYWAGLLGKATKHLPVKTVDIENSEEELFGTFQWTVSGGYIQKVVITTLDYKETIVFDWL